MCGVCQWKSCFEEKREGGGGGGVLGVGAQESDEA